MARIFLALTLEKDLNDQIIELKKELKSGLLKDSNINWQRNDHHHLTIYFVGEMEPEQISEMNEALAEVNLQHFSNVLEITDISFFPNEDSQVLAALVRSSSQINSLHKEVENIVVNIGLGTDLKAYKPHITLGRFKEKKRPQYEFEILEEPLKGKIKQIGVFESEFNKGKTDYILLRSFEF